MKTLLVERDAVCNEPDLFWRRLLNDASLQSCGDLEKLVSGCEIIAALDDLGLLAA